jgi:hypothetical protein
MVPVRNSMEELREVAEIIPEILDVRLRRSRICTHLTPDVVASPHRLLEVLPKHVGHRMMT